MRLKSSQKLSLDETKKLLLHLIQNPKSYWSTSHYGNGAAVKKVQGAKTWEELVKECRESSTWL
jgi:hypothetical protein